MEPTSYSRVHRRGLRPIVEEVESNPRSPGGESPVTIHRVDMESISSGGATVPVISPPRAVFSTPRTPNPRDDYSQIQLAQDPYSQAWDLEDSTAATQEYVPAPAPGDPLPPIPTSAVPDANGPSGFLWRLSRADAVAQTQDVIDAEGLGETLVSNLVLFAVFALTQGIQMPAGTQTTDPVVRPDQRIDMSRITNQINEEWTVAQRTNLEEMVLDATTATHEEHKEDPLPDDPLESELSPMGTTDEDIDAPAEDLSLGEMTSLPDPLSSAEPPEVTLPEEPDYITLARDMIADAKHDDPVSMLSEIAAPSVEMDAAAEPELDLTTGHESRPKRNRFNLSVDDDGPWARRAHARAAYWTNRLQEMKDAGTLAAGAWDGAPITAHQWNLTRGSDQLHWLFLADRKVQYTQFRREQKAAQPPPPPPTTTTKTGDVPPPPFDKRQRRGRKRHATGGPVQPGIQIKRGARIDFGPHFKPMTTHELLGNINTKKKFRKGKGFIENQFHRLMVDPEDYNFISKVDGGAHFATAMVSRVCLRTLLYFANEEKGDLVIPGMSDVVYHAAFEDIFNLLRTNQERVPFHYRAAFFGETATAKAMPTGVRWNKKNTIRKFGDIVDPYIRAGQNGDEFVVIVMVVVNAFIQVQLADEFSHFFGPMDAISDTNFIFLRDSLAGTVGLLDSLSVPLESIMSIQMDIKQSFESNIVAFIERSKRLLTARREI